MLTLEEVKQMSDEELSQNKVFDSLTATSNWSKEGEGILRYLLEERKFGLKRTEIPSWFFLSQTRARESVSSAARINPVSAVSGESPYESSIATPPSSKSNKKRIVISKDFFSNLDGGGYVSPIERERKDRSNARRIEQINRLRQEGFSIYVIEGLERKFRKLEGDLDEFSLMEHMGHRPSSLKNIVRFDPGTDYDRLLREEKLPRKSIALLDGQVQEELETLFFPEFCKIGLLLEGAFLDLAIRHGAYDSLSNEMDEQIFRAIRSHDEDLIAKLRSDRESSQKFDHRSDNIDKMYQVAIFCGHVRFFNYLFSQCKYSNHEWSIDKLLSYTSGARQEVSLEISVPLLQAKINILKKDGKEIVDDENIKWFFYESIKNDHLNVVKYLVEEYGFDVNLVISKKKGLYDYEAVEYRMLMVAIEANSVEMAGFLLDKGVRFEGEGQGGSKELITALKRGNPEMAKLLIQRGVREFGSYDGDFPLTIAAREGYLDVVKLVIEKDPAVVHENDNGTLKEAAKAGHLDVVKALIGAGMKVNNDKDCCMALSLASEEGHIEIVRFLVESGANLANSGALAGAAKNNHTEIVRFLIGVRVNLNNPSDGYPQESALIHAVIKNNAEIVELLIGAKANLNVFDEWHESALQIAAKKGNIDIVRLLVAGGTDVNLRYELHGNGPLIAAIKAKNIDIATFLVEEARADINLPGEYGMTALSAAINAGELEFAEMLIGRGVKVSEKDGLSLIKAIRGNKIDAIKLLIRAGVNLNFDGGNGESPLIFAIKSNHLKIVELLISEGANIDQICKGEIYEPPHSALSVAVDLKKEWAVRLLLEKGVDISNNGGLNRLLSSLVPYSSKLTDDFEEEIAIANILMDAVPDVNQVEIGETSNSALCNAVDRKCFKLMKFFVDKGLDVNLSSGYYKSTPVIVASKNGDLKTIIFLVQREADIYAPEEYEATALSNAAKGGYLQIVKFFINLVGDNKDALDRLNVQKALVDAAENGHLEIIKFLVNEVGISINPVGDKKSWGGKALCKAASGGHLEVVKFLIGKKVDLDVTGGGFGESALQLALERKYVDIARALIEAGADVNLRRDENWDLPLQIARKKNLSKEIIGLLIAKGAKEGEEREVSSEVEVLAGPTSFGADQSVYVGSARSNTASAAGGPGITDLVTTNHPPEQQPRDPTKLSIATNTGDGATGNNSIFKMQQVGESLNGSAEHRVRTDIKESYQKKLSEERKLRARNVGYSQMHYLNDFKKYCKKIDRSQYVTKNQEKDGNFYLFQHGASSNRLDTGHYSTKMFSMHCQDQLDAISVDNGAQILAMHKDKDGFLHVLTDKECKLSYVLHVPPLQKIQTVMVSKKIKEIADQYAKNVKNSAGEGSFPKEEEYSTNEEWLDAVFKSGTGDCVDRVLSFVRQLQKSGIDSDQYRVIEIDKNHVALEVRDENVDVWQYLNLGGVSGKLIDVENDYDSPPPEDTADALPPPEAESPPAIDPPPVEDTADAPSPSITAPEKPKIDLESLMKEIEEKEGGERQKELKEKELKEKELKEKEEESQRKKWTKSIKEYLRSSLEYESVRDLAALNKGFAAKTSLMVTKNAQMVTNILTHQARQENREVFCIDSPEKIDIFKQVIAIDGKGHADIWGSGFLAGFLRYSRGESQKPPLLIIDWDVFTESQKVALNTALDEEATIQGVPLQDIDLVGLSAKEPKDSSFLSRHQKLYKEGYSLQGELEKLAKETLVKTRLDDDQDEVVEVDFEGFSNWQQKLFGSISIKNSQTVWRPSNFVESLQNGGKNFLIKNLSPQGKKEFAKSLARANAQGYFDYQNRRFYISDDIKFQFAKKSFDFAKFQDSQNIKVHEGLILGRVPESAIIINGQIFDKLLHDKEVKGDLYSEVEGLIAKAAKRLEKKLELFITSALTDAQYYCLLNQVQKHGLQLDLFLAPNVPFPKELKEVGVAPDSLALTNEFLIEKQRELGGGSQRPKRRLPTPRPKIIVTNNPAQYLVENPARSKDAIILDVEDYSYQDLVESLSFEIKDQKFQNFQYKQSELIARLRQGGKIVLKGEFPESLLQMLQPILVQDFAKNLTIIVENKDLEQDKVDLTGWSWLAGTACDVKQYTPQVKRKAKSLPEPVPVTSLSDDPQKGAEEFISKRLSTLGGLLATSNLARLVGESGVGKSSLLYEYDKNPNIVLYSELPSLASWANDKTPDKQKVLFIDEANIEDLNFTMFAPMLKDGNSTIFYQGEFFELTKDHKVVFAGNDLKYGGGRNEQKLFTDYKIPTFKLKDFSADCIYQKLLKEEILDKVRERLDDIGVSGEALRYIEESFLAECSDLIDKHQQVNKNQRGSETVRELQEYALKFLAKTMANKEEKAKYEESITSKSFVSVEATKTMESALNDCLLVKSMQREGVLPAKAGLGGVFLEGGSGTGKSSLIKATLEKHDQKYYKIDAATVSQSPEEAKKIIINAFENGETIWIDEINACIESGLEKTLNAVLTGTHPETGLPAKNPGFLMVASANEASMDGRGIVSPALRHRMYCPRVSELQEYTEADISKIVHHWSECAKIEIDGGEIDTISRDYKRLLESQNTPNLRDLGRAFAKYAKENCKVKDPASAFAGVEHSQLSAGHQLVQASA